MGYVKALNLQKLYTELVLCPDPTATEFSLRVPVPTKLTSQCDCTAYIYLRVHWLQLKRTSHDRVLPPLIRVHWGIHKYLRGIILKSKFALPVALTGVWLQITLSCINIIPNDNNLVNGGIEIVHLSNKHSCHGLVQCSTVHVDGGSHRQHETSNTGVGGKVLLKALDGDWESCRAVCVCVCVCTCVCTCGVCVCVCLRAWYVGVFLCCVCVCVFCVCMGEGAPTCGCSAWVGTWGQHSHNTQRTIHWHSLTH